MRSAQGNPADLFFGFSSYSFRLTRASTHQVDGLNETAVENLFDLQGDVERRSIQLILL